MRHLFICASFLYCGYCTPALADEVSLIDSGKMQGVIESSTRDGMIQLRTQLAAEPLFFKPDAITHLMFSSKKPSTKQEQSIQLKNGDVLQAELTSYSDKTLTIQSSWNTTHQINKCHIDSLRFGSSQNNTIYSGPQKIDWQIRKGAKVIAQRDNAIHFSGRGTASWKSPQLPPRHTIGWHLDLPEDLNFTCILASSDENVDNEKQDSYTLSINQSGIQLTRRMQSMSKPVVLASIADWNKDQKKLTSFAVELRINRENRLLQLYIDGKILRSSIIDPAETGPMPTGLHYHFSCADHSKPGTKLSKFVVTDWIATGKEAREEKRISSEADTFYDVESNHASGELISISAGAKKRLKFRNPHATGLIDAPLQSAAVLYFSGESTKPKERFIVKTADSASLHVDQFTIESGNLQAQHPLLGVLKIPLTSIQEITRP